MSDAKIEKSKMTVTVTVEFESPEGSREAGMRFLEVFMSGFIESLMKKPPEMPPADQSN